MRLITFTFVQLTLIIIVNSKQIRSNYRDDLGDTNGLKCPEERGQFNHPEYCDQYVDCWDSIPAVRVCAQALLFNPTEKYCDFPQNVDCGDKTDSRPPEDIDSRCNQPYGTFANEEHCGEFVICNSGKVTVMKCPTGLSYNTTLGICMTPEEPSCLETQQINPDDDPGQPEGQPPLPDLNPETIKPAKPIGPGGPIQWPSWPRASLGIFHMGFYNGI